jgi:hypothetical protein
MNLYTSMTYSFTYNCQLKLQLGVYVAWMGNVEHI